MVTSPNFNLQEIAKHLLLMEDHLQQHYCADCIRKHLLTIEAFAEEAKTIDEGYRYGALADGLDDMVRKTLEDVADAQDKGRIRDIAQGIRKYRKALVPLVYDPRGVHARKRIAAVVLARGTCTHKANTLKIPADFMADGGWEFGNGEWRERAKLSPSQLREWAGSQKGKLKVPVGVWIYKDGLMGFHDGHHRVFAAKVLGVPVLVDIEKNDLKPEVWSAYLDRIQHGFTYREINPEGDNLNRIGVPSVSALKAGRKTSLRDYALVEFYQQFEGKVGFTHKRGSVLISDKTLTKRFKAKDYDPATLERVKAAVMRIPQKFLAGLREIILFPREKASFYVDVGADGEYQANTRTVMVSSNPSMGSVEMVVVHEIGHHVADHLLSREQQVRLQEKVGFRIEDWGEDFASCFGFYFSGSKTAAQHYPVSFDILQDLL